MKSYSERVWKTIWSKPIKQPLRIEKDTRGDVVNPNDAQLSLHILIT